MKTQQQGFIGLHEVQWTAVRAQGAGGQNVNKLASAVHLRFDVRASRLPQAWQQRLLDLGDRRISSQGVVVIKAQQHRTQELNLRAALQRLNELVASVAHEPRVRRATRPTRGSELRRLEGKSRRSRIKSLRSRNAEF
ncbi:alternative ribosome rescue aminoacyl-tRNA hydrolase ArfB [Comamonas composti]|uniref:alternative ribosome rescue aminoacyl-tRNA hydrolase ArfB n=1 Tax=Comamonas composti TaxID=408558 RepID=UPI000403690E|nr:alternative ribosome rescue aminoacyl-tRNA hydrolase ArfB [Comamonas composti]